MWVHSQASHHSACAKTVVLCGHVYSTCTADRALLGFVSPAHHVVRLGTEQAGIVARAGMTEILIASRTQAVLVTSLQRPGLILTLSLVFRLRGEHGGLYERLHLASQSHNKDVANQHSLKFQKYLYKFLRLEDH